MGKIRTLAIVVWKRICTLAIALWKRICALAIFIWNNTITLIGAVIGLYWVNYSYNKYPFNEFISYFALLVAAIAALAALMSLKHARDTVRPFLSFNGTINLGETTLAFPIRNTGSLPANDIKFRIDAFGIKESVGSKNISKVYAGVFVEPIVDVDTALIIFPDQIWQEVLGQLTKDNYSKRLNWMINGEIKVRTSIKYKSLKRNHMTIQTFKFDGYSLTSDKKKLHGISVEPHKWT